MGIATGLVALILFVLGALVSFGTYDSTSIANNVLSVFIKQKEAQPTSVPEPVDQPLPPVSRESEAVTETAPMLREEPDSAPSEPPVVESSPVDWATEITAAVIALESENEHREKVRESMWRQTRSVMFAPIDEFVPNEPQPVIENLRFKPEIHVVGLGVKVGSCFIGLPLVGVPVEKRTIGIRLFVCADESG